MVRKIYTFLKKFAAVFGITRDNVKKARVSLRRFRLFLAFRLQRRRAFRGSVLTRAVLMLDKKEINVDQFDSLLKIYYKK